MKALSFCITCKNRLWQIKRTLPANLRDNRGLRSKIEFILIDFGSTDGLGAWVKKEFKLELKEGYLKYFFTEKLPHWHACIAKNTAHLFATGSIVVNLDCDNYTGKNGGLFLLNRFKAYNCPVVVHQFSGKFFDGSFGRIAVQREVFAAIGGYDEQFAPMGFQDLDLLARLSVMGVRYVNIKNRNFNKAIYNSKQEGIALCNSKMTFMEMNTSNRNLSLENFRRSRNPTRNNGAYGLSEDVFDAASMRIAPAGTLPSLSYEELMRKHKLTPPSDLSLIMQTAYGEVA